MCGTAVEVCVETFDSDVRRRRATRDSPHLTHLIVGAACASSMRRCRAQGSWPAKLFRVFERLLPSCGDQCMFPESSTVCTQQEGFEVSKIAFYCGSSHFVAVHRILFRFVFTFLKRPPNLPNLRTQRHAHHQRARHMSYRLEPAPQQHRLPRHCTNGGESTKGHIKRSTARTVETRTMDWELISEQVLRHVEECLPRAPSSSAAVNLDRSETSLGSDPSGVYAVPPARPAELQTINRSHR